MKSKTEKTDSVNAENKSLSFRKKIEFWFGDAIITEFIIKLFGKHEEQTFSVRLMKILVKSTLFLSLVFSAVIYFIDFDYFLLVLLSGSFIIILIAFCFGNYFKTKREDELEE